jgi:hypothetical protein
MADAITAAFPFIEVTIDTSGLQPVAQRAPGVVAVVGKTPQGAKGGDAQVNTPVVVETDADAIARFASTGAPTTLSQSLSLVLAQNPRPSKVYGVRVDNNGDYGAALASLEGVDDVTFVSLANETTVGAAATTGSQAKPASDLMALKEHVESMSKSGQKRLGVAMVDPTRARTPSYVADVLAVVEQLRSSSSRMILIAARGATVDAASAAMGAIAGLEPHISIVLKRVQGVTMPPASQYGPSEIKAMAEAGLTPLIDPALILGTSLHFADGRTFTANDDQLWVDLVRVLDDIEFRLKAGLIGTVGDARITKAGLTLIKARMEGILGSLLARAVIDGFSIALPVLDILSLPESARSKAENDKVEEARQNRAVEIYPTIVYGPAVHRLMVKLTPTF